MSTPTWRFDQDNLWRLPGAHGDEVVRSVYLDEQVCLSRALEHEPPSPALVVLFSGDWLTLNLLQSQSVFTCGEDGFVRAWKPVEGGNDDTQNPAGSGKIPRSKEKKQRDRFKPY